MNHISSTQHRPHGLGLVAVALLALSLGACASAPVPKEQMAVSQAAVERVSGPAGAEAPGEVASARDKLALAQRAMANKDYVLARQLAEQADADAALAEAKSRASRSDTALTQVQESIRALKAELARS
jgi:hypothetical protein